MISNTSFVKMSTWCFHRNKKNTLEINRKEDEESGELKYKVIIFFCNS